MELFLDKEMMIVSETDPKGNILYANADFVKLSEYAQEELIGKPHNILRHPDMPKAAFKDLWSTLQTGRTWQGIIKNRTKNNNFYWVNATVYPSKDSQGNLRYISVRVKPTHEEIEAAIELYQTLN